MGNNRAKGYMKQVTVTSYQTQTCLVIFHVMIFSFNFVLSSLYLQVSTRWLTECVDYFSALLQKYC